MMKHHFLLRISAFTVIALSLACAPFEEASVDTTALNAEIDTAEERTEAFANQMLDLSMALRDDNRPALEAHVGTELRSNGFPAHRADSATIDPLVDRFDWPLGEATELSGAAFVDSILAFRANFSEIEDVRFKVKASTLAPDGVQLDAKMKFWLIARNPNGQREWIKGLATAHAKLGETWALDRFEITDLSSKLARREIFRDVAGPAGIAAFDPPHAQGRNEAFAAHGAAAGDIDGDGLLDLVFTGVERNYLYRNLGDGRFEDIAESAYIAVLPATATAPLLFDFDGDGDLDLFLASTSQQMLFENRLVPDGSLELVDISLASGVAKQAIGFSAAVADVDGNGWPDIYVASYQRYGAIMPDAWDGASNGTPNLLLLNQGDGHFIESASDWGIADSHWSYGATFADVDGDFDADLFVANDFGGPSRLYINLGDRFEASALEDHGYGMGGAFGDANEDGELDLHVSRMSSTAGRRILGRLGVDELPDRDRLELMAVGNALYLGDGEGGFAEATNDLGPLSGGWAWGGGFIDIDNDGRQDLYTPNGFISGASLKDT